ncbi:MAG: hypothetical protein ACJA08_002796 [Cyclobacteriaceae bacterium]|jgi:hypothetical protein
MAMQDDFIKQLRKALHLLLLILGLFLITGGLSVYYIIDPNLTAFKSEPDIMINPPLEVDKDRIENGIHVRTGLIEAEGLMTVVNNCTGCHSSKLIIQNRMNAERWNATIKWMQETQNLWNLDANQEIIVNYLVSNYPPKDKGRREILSNIEWYELED